MKLCIKPRMPPNLTECATIFNCPNTRKGKRDYAALNVYGLLAEDIPLPRPRRRPSGSPPSHPLRFQPLLRLLVMFLGLYRALIQKHALHDQYPGSKTSLRWPNSSRITRLGWKSGAWLESTTVRHLNPVPGDSEIRSGPSTCRPSWGLRSSAAMPRLYWSSQRMSNIYMPVSAALLR